MKQLEDIMFQIEELRKELNNSIREKKKLTDLKVVETSQKLDKVLNVYNEIVSKLKKNSVDGKSQE